MATMEAVSLIFLLITITLSTVYCNIEGDSLHIFRTNLNDPNNVLQSWDPTLINPCTWFHITCNNDNFVIRVDLGNAGLSGSLVPSLLNLTKLQYLQLGGNNIAGVIPREFGNYKSLVSLGLEHNQLTGSIPSSLGKLRTLRFLRVDGNHLSGTIPTQILQLILWGNLEELNLSDNNFAGTIRNTQGKTGYAITTIVQDPRAPK